MWISNTIVGVILLALAVAGAWRWYDSHLKAQGKNQMVETAAREPGLTEPDFEVQAVLMDICMKARGYVFLSSCTEATPNAGRTYSLGYKFNSICWRKN
jgi:hypothetical protein